MKKIISLLMMVLFYSINFSQVGINTATPNSKTLLHVSEKNQLSDPVLNKGIIIPRLTESQRNAIVPGATENSLLVFNTTENCYNFWNNPEQEWKSLCGQLGKAIFTVDCSKTVAMGSYIKSKELTAANYLKLTINVTKVGNYTISASTTNGYNFYGTGVFLNLGPQVVQIPGQGIPLNVQTDNLIINANGTDVMCTPAVSINVLSPAATYTMSCGKATVNGVYKVGTAITSTNTITLPVNVASLGSYTITTNTVDGISFSASGTFTSTGNQNIILSGAGTPSSTSTKILTITSDSQGGVSTTCTVNVVVVIPIKKLLSIGTSEDGYGYNLSGIAASGRMISASSNFGTSVSSVVKSEGFTRINGTNSPSLAQLQGWLQGSSPVDILVLGYSWTPSDTEADVIADYLVKGGVVLAFSESNAGMQRLFRYVFNDNTITAGSVNTAGSLYRLPVVNDDIMNGPFGDIRGKTWGEDASATTYASGIPVNLIDVYSTDSDLSLASPGGVAGRVTAFKHKTLNFLWIGDGGFNSNCGASDTICPFQVNASNYPIVKASYGRGIDALDQDVYNAIFTANAIAWAIKQAEFNGINTQ